MKQLLILSGKGGTGKTTVASALIKLSNAKAYADCDVDAPNLHLIMAAKTDPERRDYYGLPKAKIDPKRCTACDRCRESCRFEAIIKDQDYKVDAFACEGCGVCVAVCPVNAVTLNPAVAGELMLHTDENRVFSTAQLKMGSGNSGLLVSEVKKQLKTAAVQTELAIIDGSPGIGCPVIASLSGVDLVLIITEPSVSGLSDLERIIKTAGTFQIKTAVCINKYDTNRRKTAQIEDYCRENEIPVVGHIPFDPLAVEAINNGKTIVDLACPAGEATRRVFAHTLDLLLMDSQNSADAD